MLGEGTVNILTGPSSWGQVVFVPQNWTSCDVRAVAGRLLSVTRLAQCILQSSTALM